MALIEIDTNSEGVYVGPFFDANNSVYGRADETYLRITSTQGARPRVMGARYRRSVGQVHWDVQVPQPSRIRLPAHSEYTVHELKAGGSYEVVIYPSRTTVYLHVQQQGYGSLGTVMVWRSNTLEDAEDCVIRLASAPRGDMTRVSSPLPQGTARPVPQSVQSQREQTSGRPSEYSYGPPFGGDLMLTKTPVLYQGDIHITDRRGKLAQPPMVTRGPKDRFDRILNEHDEWDDKFQTWKTNQPIEDALAQQMNALEIEKIAETERRLQAKKVHVANLLKNNPLSEKDLDAILASVLKEK